jgi:hypothetical protein
VIPELKVDIRPAEKRRAEMRRARNARRASEWCSHSRLPLAGTATFRAPPGLRCTPSKRRPTSDVTPSTVTTILSSFEERIVVKVVASEDRRRSCSPVSSQIVDRCLASLQDSDAKRDDDQASESPSDTQEDSLARLLHQHDLRDVHASIDDGEMCAQGLDHPACDLTTPVSEGFAEATDHAAVETPRVSIGHEDGSGAGIYPSHPNGHGEHQSIRRTALRNQRRLQMRLCRLPARRMDQAMRDERMLKLCETLKEIRAKNKFFESEYGKLLRECSRLENVCALQCGDICQIEKSLLSARRRYKIAKFYAAGQCRKFRLRLLPCSRGGSSAQSGRQVMRVMVGS